MGNRGSVSKIISLLLPSGTWTLYKLFPKPPILCLVQSLTSLFVFCIGHYSPETSRDRSPEDVSPIFPDRPIRPLPKRKLRERLSPDVAGTIKYPPAPPTTTPLFYYPYNLNGEEDRPRGEQYQIDRQRAKETDRNYIPKNKGDDVDSEEEVVEIGPNRGRHVRHSPEPKGKPYRYVQKASSSVQYPSAELPLSATSSVDGYDSFENTNNKKKRKIPTPGDAGPNGIHLSSELASLGISQDTDEKEYNDIQSQHSATPIASYASLSGPGRGRYGRVRSGRSPMRTLSDANSRTPKQRQHGPNGMFHSDGRPAVTNVSKDESSGIISTAIANAEKLPVTSARGQENVSLLQQVTPKASPASTQFTFTCDSQVPGTVTWPGPLSKDTMHQSVASRRTMSTRATQTSPSMPSQGPSRQLYTDPQTSTVNGKQAAPKKTRRRTGKEYLIAARQRREQQEYQNYHHPPAPEDEWICEFCEYERIFGTPPEALIRQYELKDRRARKQEAERRRLLEKAKLKGRKGKRGTKSSTKNPAASQQHAQQGPNPLDQNLSQGTQSEEYGEDDDDDYYARDIHVPSDSAHTQFVHAPMPAPADPRARTVTTAEAGIGEQGIS